MSDIFVVSFSIPCVIKQTTLWKSTIKFAAAVCEMQKAEVLNHAYAIVRTRSRSLQNVSRQ